MSIFYPRTSGSETRQKKMPFYINRNFAFTWIGSSVSSLGDTVLDTTLVLWMVTRLARGQPWAPLAVSGIFLAASIPVLALGPIAGVFADWWVEKKRLMMRMDLARAVLTVLLLVGTLITSLADLDQGRFWLFLQLGMLYGVVGLVSVCSQFFSPASSVLFYDIVEEAHRARASGLFQFVFSIATIGGPPLATWLFFASGVQWALLLDAFSFLISFCCLLLVRVPLQTSDTGPSEEKKSFFHQFREGVRFYVTNSVLMMILITGILIFAWTSAFQVLGVFFVSQNLHASISWYGFIGMAAGGGFAGGAVFASVFASRVGVTHLFWSSMLVMGMLVICYSRMTHFFPALCIVFLIGCCAAAINVTVSPIAMHVTPRALIARVVSVLTPVMTLASMLYSLLIGWLISSVLRNFHATILGMSFGQIDMIYFLTGCLALVGGFYAMVKVRGVRLANLLCEVQQALDVPIRGVISDGQHSIGKAVQAVLPDVPHQLCHFHYLREAAKPVYEADRHAKKELKKYLRGVRPIERAVEKRNDTEAEAIRGYCQAVRSSLTDDGHPPLEASGLKLHKRISTIVASLARVSEKGAYRAS